MHCYDFWITLGVMSVIFLVVVVIKSIPKYKLPYCLGGTKGCEPFICSRRYDDWCRSHNLHPVFDQQKLAMFKRSDAKEVANRTLLANGRNIDSIKPDF